MSDSEEDDAHFCLRCKGTFIGLDFYIEHRKVKCKRDESQPLTSLELQFSKDSSGSVHMGGGKVDIPSGSDTSHRGSWSLEGLQNSSPSVKDDPRLEDVLEMNRKGQILDPFLPSHDNDPCLKAVDFFSILELQSSKHPTFHELSSSQKSQAGMVTRSKTSAVLQAKRNKEPFTSKAMTPDYQYDPYHSEHSQYVVGKDVVITDNYDYQKDVVGALKERKNSDLDSPKSKSRSDDRILEEDGKSSQFLFQEVHNEVTISSEGKMHDESDSYSEESEEEDEDEEYETRRISTGGKWKPAGSEWASTSYWSSAPPASHTGGKWKPSPPPPPPPVATSTLDMPSTSSTHHDEILIEPQVSCERSVWWVAVLETATHWLLSADSEAERLYTRVEGPPAPSEPLVCALLAGYHVRKAALSTSPPTSLLQLCDSTSRLLQESLTVDACHKPDTKVLLAQLLVCDWLLETRTAVWEDQGGSSQGPVQSEQLSGFQADLSSLCRLTQELPCGLARVFLYKATVRMMAGAAPGRTQQLLDRSLRHRTTRSNIICGKDKSAQDVGGEREHAAALYLACRHLPTPLLASPGERAGMLLDAAKTLEKIGDRKKLQQCYHLMQSLGTSAVTN